MKKEVLSKENTYMCGEKLINFSVNYPEDRRWREAMDE